MRPTIITEAEAMSLSGQLENSGKTEGIDFYVEEVFDITEYYEAVGHCIATENEFENGDYYIEDKEILDAMHTEKRTIGYTLTTEKGYVDIAKIDVTNIMNSCCVCGMKLVINRTEPGDDKRVEPDGIKCFDCAGLPAKYPLVQKIVSLPIKGDKEKQAKKPKAGLEVEVDLDAHKEINGMMLIALIWAVSMILTPIVGVCI